MRSVIIIMLAVLFVFLGCSKEDMPGSVQIKADVALCCNPWDEFQSDETELIKHITQFLFSEGISTMSVHLKEGKMEWFCVTCCHCPTGDEFHAQIRRKDLKKALDLGFSEN